MLTALVVAFGTLLWPYAKFGFNAALATAALTAGVYGVAAGTADRRAWMVAAGGAALGAALLTRHELLIAAAIAVAWVAWQMRRDPAGPRVIAGRGDTGLRRSRAVDDTQRRAFRQPVAHGP